MDVIFSTANDKDPEKVKKMGVTKLRPVGDLKTRTPLKRFENCFFI